MSDINNNPTQVNQPSNEGRLEHNTKLLMNWPHDISEENGSLYILFKIGALQKDNLFAAFTEIFPESKVSPETDQGKSYLFVLTGEEKQRFLNLEKNKNKGLA